MPDRDNRTISLSRQTLLVVTGVGVGLLTLTYVLGVQVGKQSAALRKVATKGSGEDLQELPMPVAEQLRQLELATRTKAVPPPPNQPPAPKPETPPPGTTPPPTPSIPSPTPPPKPPTPPLEPGHRTPQLITPPDAPEAPRPQKRLSEKGFPATTLQDKQLYKVRIAKATTREEVNKINEKLKARGFKPFVLKVD